MAARTLSGPQKAAVLLLQLGTERSAPVLRALDEQQIAGVMAEVARLHEVDAETAQAVFTEFASMAETRSQVRSGGIELARALLEKSLGPQKGGEIFHDVTSTVTDVPFSFLRGVDPKELLTLLQDEHSQTIAVVLAHLAPTAAATLVGGLPPERQREAARRLAVMDRTSPEFIEEVERVLERKLSSVAGPASELSVAGGVQALVDILNRSDRVVERSILEGLASDDEELADEVRQLMFVFEDIVNLDDKSVQLVLRQVDTKDLAVALKGVRAEVRDTIARNMSQRAATMLIEEIELLGPVRLKNVEEAQAGIVRTIRQLEESGQLVLDRGADEYVV